MESVTNEHVKKKQFAESPISPIGTVEGGRMSIGQAIVEKIDQSLIITCFSIWDSREELPCKPFVQHEIIFV